jgi:hypothetical protein
MTQAADGIVMTDAHGAVQWSWPRELRGNNLMA